MSGRSERVNGAVRLVPPTVTGPAEGGPSTVVARHETQIMGKTFSFCLNAPEETNRREVSVALAAAVAELRAVEYTFSPLREESLVSMLRRDELRPDAYPPPLADVMSRCVDMRAATEGWFDAWAVPGGFDPGGMVTGWGIERAAALIRSAGITSYSISGGGDILVSGYAPDGNPWQVDLHDTRLELTEGAVATSCPSPRGVRVVNPHSGEPITSPASAAVVGPDLCVADAYSTALYAAGPIGLGWFSTVDGYTGYLLGDDRTVPEPVSPVAETVVETVIDAAPATAPVRTNRNVSPARTPRQRMIVVTGTKT